MSLTPNERRVAVQIGKRLKALRRSWGFSLEAVSEFLEPYPQELLSEQESGKRIISMSEAVHLAEIYGTNLEYLVWGKGTAPKGLNRRARKALGKQDMKCFMFANRVIGAFHEYREQTPESKEVS